MQVVIVANGELAAPISSYDYDFLIAVDNGLHYCLQQKCIPDLLIGDLDSVSTIDMVQAQQLNIPTQQYPREKDQTDLELALLHAIECLAAKKIIVLATMGGRDDMCLANALILTQSQFRDYDIELVGLKQSIHLITENKPFIKQLALQRIVSLLPITLTVEGVTTQGLEYPLSHATLYIGSTRSISNVVTEELVSISICSGLLLVLL